MSGYAATSSSLAPLVLSGSGAGGVGSGAGGVGSGAGGVGSGSGVGSTSLSFFFFFFCFFSFLDFASSGASSY